MALRKIIIVGWIDPYFLSKLDAGFKPLSDNYERFGQNHCRDKEQEVILLDLIRKKELPGDVKVRVTIEVKE
jgi:hypothetical protein